MTKRTKRNTSHKNKRPAQKRSIKKTSLKKSTRNKEDKNHVETTKRRVKNRVSEEDVAMKPVPKKNENVYFTRETEEAIISYINAGTIEEKNEIYNRSIKHAFEKIAENIYNKFKFSYSDVSPIDVQRQAVSHMVANISKYDVSKGKAFSYFSIVAKHWFILDNNNTYRRFTKHVEICEQPGETGEFLVEPDTQNKASDLREFVKLMVEFWDNNVNKYFTKDRDLKIANAVVEIFRRSDAIDQYNKKALYLYIREISGCHTQHITKVVNKMKFTQKNIMMEYLKYGVITGERVFPSTVIDNCGR